MTIDSNNILLITDYEDTAKNLLEKLVLLRENDNITVCNTKNMKKFLENSMYYIAILHEADSKNTTLRLINTIKEINKDIEIILVLDDCNQETILEAYDNGIYDYFTTDSAPYEMLIKTVNCFKLRQLKEVANRNIKFLNQMNITDAKSGFYQYKALKDIFLDISDNLRVQNGFFVLVTLDEKTKTKVSTSRLAQAIKNNIRQDDIVATARGGKFYLIFPNLDLAGTNAVLGKIQDKMGEDLKIRAGLAKIGVQSFETLDKIAQDGLISAGQNEVMSVCFEDNENTDNWLSDDLPTEKKNFKLFQTSFSNKMNSIITPNFFRFQKECETKLTNTQVSQYANNIECVFSLKNKNAHSELIIRYNGYAKFKIELIHNGLDSPENFKTEIPLKEMTEKYLNSLLKRLKDEYKSTAYKQKEN
ncbi:MAG: hypothetical protein ACI37Q_07640 [Candidatus Gastranaerophilaceae bacterium]